jgi:hypothetical protein
MHLQIKINLENAAFEDAPDRELEQIFYRIREEISMGEKTAVVMDANGNRIGAWRIGAK